MRHLTRLAAFAGAVAAIACANRGGAGPPGGPVAKVPPVVQRITPESGSVNQHPGSVQFYFSRVINDNGNLDRYMLISPRDGEPRINWHMGGRIEVKPRHGFRPNTAYTVTLLPGLADVAGNVMKEGAVTVFSTGATLPRFGIVGTIFDWAAERPAANAVVEAISRPDSVVYITVADSLGTYSLGPFGEGRYTLIGFIDRNNNRAIDPNEAWDSTTVLITTVRPSLPLLAITRDTIPPRISGVERTDSTTLRVTFDRALDPSMTLTPALFRVQRTDSTALPIARVVGARAATDSVARRDSTVRRDSLRRDTTVRRDTTPSRVTAPPAAAPGAAPSVVPLPGASRPTAGRPAPARPGSAVAPPPPKPPRPAPETSVLITLAPPTTLTPGTTYRITARDVRNIMGRAGTSNRTYTVPKPPPPSTRDTVRSRDSSRVRDSTRVPPRRPPI